MTATDEVFSVDYTELLTAIAENQQIQLQLIQEQNATLLNILDILYWIFFILAFYGVYKIFLGTIASWFNGY